MALADLVARTRTVRRFREEVPLAPALLEQLVDLARLGGSARNAQSLCYLIVTEPSLRAALFPLLAWAGYLPDWPGPAAGERPAAYIVCVLDRERQRGPESEAHFDLGISTQNLLLGAAERGVLGCRIGAFNADRMRTLLQLDARYQPMLVVALGEPAETVVVETVRTDGDVRYWRDADGVHHVPKRPLGDILLAPPRP
jgi:nitroreductase